MNGTKTNESPETTIGARDDPLAANKFGVALYPLRDQFRMFKHIGFGVDYAGDYEVLSGASLTFSKIVHSCSCCGFAPEAIRLA